MKHLGGLNPRDDQPFCPVCKVKHRKREEVSPLSQLLDQKTHQFLSTSSSFVTCYVFLNSTSTWVTCLEVMQLFPEWILSPPVHKPLERHSRSEDLTSTTFLWSCCSVRTFLQMFEGSRCFFVFLSSSVDPRLSQSLLLGSGTCWFFRRVPPLIDSTGLTVIRYFL